MASPEQYADWIVKNQDKRGTPEFETVAAAYKMARQQNAPQPRPQVEMPTPEEPSLMARMGRGYMDIAQGTKQKVLGYTDPEAAKQYTAQVNSEVGDYEQNLQGSGFEGADLSRATGQALPFMAIPGGQKSAAARFGTGAGGAALQSYLNFDESGKDNPMQTGVNALLGGAVNTLAPVAMDKVMQGGQFLGRKLAEGLRRGKQALSPNITNEITVNLKATLANKGIDWDGLGERLQTAMLADAKEQMAVTGALDADQLLRKADIEAVAGVGSATKAQVTRSPNDWSIERNLQKTEANLPDVRTGGSDSLTNRYQTQDAARANYARMIDKDMLANVPQDMRAGTPYQASEMAAKAVKEGYETEGKAVSKMYESIRSGYGDQFGMAPEKLSAKIAEHADDINAGLAPRAAAALSSMKKLGIVDEAGNPIESASGKSVKALTVDQAETLRKRLGQLWSESTDRSERRILKSLQMALDDDVIDGAKMAGLPEDVFEPARKAAAERFKKYSAEPLEDLLEGGDTSKFFSRYVTNGNPKQLADALKVMPQEVQSNIKANVWSTVVDNATQGGKNPITGAALARELRKIGPDRMKVLFNQSERAQIDTLKRAALAMTDVPPHSAVNNSNTGAMLMSQLMKYGNSIPGAGLLVKPVTDQLEASAQQKLLSQALSAEGANATKLTAADAAFRKMLIDKLGAVSFGPLAVAGVGAQQQ